MKYAVAEFIKETSKRNEENSFFELESSQTLEINLNGSVWTKLGAMIAYYGNIAFKRQGLSEQGMNMVFKKMLAKIR